MPDSASPAVLASDPQAAMDACPVSCIHWVDKADLPALEFVTRYKVGRAGGASCGSTLLHPQLVAAAPVHAVRPAAQPGCSGGACSRRHPLPAGAQVKRTSVAAMMSQQGMVVDVWAAAAKYLKERRNKCVRGRAGGGGPSL